MSQVDLFEDIVHAVATGVSEKDFKQKILLIKKRHKLSYDRIYKKIDNMINTRCWSYKYWSDDYGRYLLPFNVMIGKKYWDLSQYIDLTNTRSREDQVLTIQLLAES